MFLGHIVSEERVVVVPSRIEAIMNWKQPKKVTKVRSTLGLIGYYHRFVEVFTRLVRPFIASTLKDHKFIWIEHFE